MIKDQLKMAIIEVIPNKNPSKNVHFMQHYSVVCRGRSTMKMHVVYDVSAKTANSPSLNDCLLKGVKFKQLILPMKFNKFTESKYYFLENLILVKLLPTCAKVPSTTPCYN